MLIKENPYFHVTSQIGTQLFIVPYQTGSSTKKDIYYTELICIYTHVFGGMKHFPLKFYVREE